MIRFTQLFLALGALLLTSVAASAPPAAVSEAASRGAMLSDVRNADTEQVRVEVEGMDCGGCATRLQKVLSRLEGASAVEVSFENHLATLTCGKSLTSKAITEAVEKAGFKVVKLTRTATTG